MTEKEKELRQKHGVPTLELGEIEFQKFQGIGLKEIEKILDEGSVNQMEFWNKISFDDMPHFDVTIMNPPYGANKTKNRDIHFDITDEIRKFSNEVISIMPIRLYKSSKKEDYDERRNNYKKELVSVTEISSKVFEDRAMFNVGIFHFSKMKNIDDDPIITLIDNRTDTSNYETVLLSYLKNDSPNFNPFRPTGDDKTKNLNTFCNNYIKNRWANDNKIFLISSLANGQMNGKFFSKRIGQICKSNIELKNLLIECKGACCTIMTFDTVFAAENCKKALCNPVLRFALYKLQDDQSMTARVYSIVPNINWEDPRVVTDEGLLEVCGCPVDKCKEYAEYCKNYMEKVDNGTLNS